MSPGEYSHSDSSNHAMSLGLSHYRGPHDTLPISDNNVSTTNDALEAGDWEVPESEAELDVSVMKKISDGRKNISTEKQIGSAKQPVMWVSRYCYSSRHKCVTCHAASITIYTKTASASLLLTAVTLNTEHGLSRDCGGLVTYSPATASWGKTSGNISVASVSISTRTRHLATLGSPRGANHKTLL